MTVCDAAIRPRSTPLLGYTFESDVTEPGGSRFTDRRAPSPGSGWSDGRASYGFGLETFALGFPIHFDWSWRTLFNKDWEDYVFSYQGIAGRRRPAASGCARPKFSVWIGYDF